MTRGILIAGNDSTLFSATAAETVKRVESFASAIIPNRFPLPEPAAEVRQGRGARGEPQSSRASVGVPPAGGAGVLPPRTEAAGSIPLSWNPASPISARTLMLAAENRLAQINDAIIICSPPAVFKTPENLLPEEIEILVNDHIRGWFFLIRELVLYFRRCGEGSLSLVVPETPVDGKNAAADLLGPSASASFRAFASGVLTQGGQASPAGEPFKVMGFTTAEAGSEGDFAAWFFKIIDEGAPKNSGRWHKYSKRKFF